MHGRRDGFTLLEMLVALGVFAVLGVMSTQMVGRVMAVHEVGTTRGERLAEIERAMRILERDVIELAPRTVRDGLGDPLPALQLGVGPLMELTRIGHRNPLVQKRSELQRVAYVLEERTLYRYYWNVLDRAEDSEPLVQELLTDVDTVEATVIDVSGNEHTSWPPLLDAAESPESAIAGIKVALTFAPFGEVLRIWDVPQGVPAPSVPQDGSEAPQERSEAS